MLERHSVVHRGTSWRDCHFIVVSVRSFGNKRYRDSQMGFRIVVEVINAS